jgi:hypothetical protein
MSAHLETQAGRDLTLTGSDMTITDAATPPRRLKSMHLLVQITGVRPWKHRSSGLVMRIRAVSLVAITHQPQCSSTSPSRAGSPLLIFGRYSSVVSVGATITDALILTPRLV